MRRSVAARFALALLLAGCAIQEPHPHEPHEHGAGTQTVQVFGGGTNEFGDVDGLTFGLDYEYRITPRVGASAFAEFVSGSDRSFAGGVQAVLHATERIALFAGVGQERNEHEWSPIGRVGASYEFPLSDGLFFAPSISYDVSEHKDLIVYGFNLGFTF